MSKQSHCDAAARSIQSIQANDALVPLYSPKQVYGIEKAWFDAGNDSYALMQQAAWQIAHWIYRTYSKAGDKLKVGVWVGRGNNGGDGWLVADYLTQLGAQVAVIEVGPEVSTADALLAKQQATATLNNNKQVIEQTFTGHLANQTSFAKVCEQSEYLSADVYVDALFGIGLDRAPQSAYADAIRYINAAKQHNHRLQVVSVDVPSGVVSSTGEVFDEQAVRADITLCLVARKVGLHLKDAMDYTGKLVDLPLIPTVLGKLPQAWLQHHAQPLPARDHNTHKGSFGHVLIAGGNQVDGSQGMGGAAILSASTAFATGVGKLTVACHKAFHGSLIGAVPNAMSLDLHDASSVESLIAQCDTLAIGMGFGRDESSFTLFERYLRTALQQSIALIIDADGLFHLASLAKQAPEIIDQLIAHAKTHEVWYTPHSGEAGRLLDISADEIEKDRLAAITQLANKYNGSWLLKGAGSLVLHKGEIRVCAAGNAGMATAGMGDVLSGLAAGLLAQSVLPKSSRTLIQAVMIHAMAGDVLERKKGVWALQASDMPPVVGQIMQQLTQAQ